MLILHIYGARATSILFFGQQDTESDYQEMDISLAWSIVNQKNSNFSVCEQDIHTILQGRYKLW